MTRYEAHRCEEDPFCVMAGINGEDIDWWEPIAEETLRKWHRGCLADDERISAEEKADWEEISGEAWEDTPVDFDEFITQQIEVGNIREAQ